jgi:ABC-2 type transport system permease protein
VAYLAGVACVALAVSGRSRTARQALAILIAGWAVNAVLAPRLATEVARWCHPAPSAFAFAEQVEREIYGGLDVHTFTRQRARDLERRLLQQYRVDRVEDLPVNFRGIDYLEREAHADRVFDAAYGRLWATFERQAAVQQAAGGVAPLLAARSLSMAVAGTDFAHHRDFAHTAEMYRRLLVRTMNDDLAHGTTSAKLAYTADSDLWSRVPAFSYLPPALGHVLARQTWSLAALALWLVLGAAALARVISTVRVV